MNGPQESKPLPRNSSLSRKIFEAFSDSRIIYFLPPPVDEVKIAKTDAKRSIKGIKEYHDAAKALCESHTVSYIDSFRVFKPLMDNGQEYHIEDGVHFNDFAYEIIAKELAGILNS